MSRYINADALMEDLRIVKPITETEAVAFRFAYCKVKDAPTADVRENVHAHWEAINDVRHPYRCSNCGSEFDVETMMLRPLWNFCPICGADTRGETDE